MKKTNALRKLWYNLSPGQRFFIRKMYYFPMDLWDKISGKTEKYVAPRGAIYTGSPASAKEYLKQGQQQLTLLKQYIDLKPDDSVLDIGSGIGRTAIALTSFLGSKGKYEGFDAVEKGVKWCNSKIKKDFPNFNFNYVPLYNDLYNTSEINASGFVFPYPDNSFDKVFSFSVFTHMQIGEIENYLKETERVLKPGGKSFSTLFIYNSVTEDFISTRENFNFPVKENGFRWMSDKVKSSNIAISESLLNEMISKTNLSNLHLVDGFWKDEIRDPNKLEYQDILVLQKED